MAEPEQAGLGVTQGDTVVAEPGEQVLVSGPVETVEQGGTEVVETFE